MPFAFQRRRGTTAQHASFTGLLAELTVDTDKKTVVVHDGTTAGGIPLVHATTTDTLTNKTLTSPTVNGGTLADAVIKGLEEDVNVVASAATGSSLASVLLAESFGITHQTLLPTTRLTLDTVAELL